MPNTAKCLMWVVYRQEIHGKPTGANAVCEQGEWDAMGHAQLAQRSLIRSGIVSEGEAEQLARSSPICTSRNDTSISAADTSF